MILKRIMDELGLDRTSSGTSSNSASTRPAVNIVGTSPLRKKKKLLIMTTVSSTFENNLVSQPSYLSEHYRVMICSSPSDGLKEFAEKEGVPYREVPMYRGIHPIKDLVSILRFFMVLLEYKPDIVHSYTPKAGLVNAVTGFFRRGQISIHTYTGLVFLGERGIKRRILICVDRLIARLATEVIPEGEGVRSNLVSYRIASKPAPVLWHGNINGVDLTRFSPDVRRRLRRERRRLLPKATDDSIVFSFVGRVNRHKGFEELVCAFMELRKHYTDVFLVVAGRVEEKNPVSSRALSILYDHPNVRYLGFTRDVESVFAIADVNVLPSYREGVPNVVLQSSAMGVPSIVTDIPGCRDLVVDGVNGWRVEAKNGRELKRIMEMVINLPDEDLAKIGGNAHSLVSRKFDRKDVQKHLLTYYAETLSRHRGN